MKKNKWVKEGIGNIRGIIGGVSKRGTGCINKEGNKIGSILGLLLIFMFVSVAEGATKKKKTKKRVVIDFQDELLEGNVSNPSIFHLFHKKQLRYGRLIKFRKNFLPEMRRTAREIK